MRGSGGSSEEPRIVVFGATGFTGGLVVDALVARGARPVLAGRDPDRLRALSAEHGDLAFHVADAADEDAIRALLSPGDVLISTVGPFVRHGWAAARAASRAGVDYLDSTGEPPFVRRVFEQLCGDARRSGARLLPAFGYDYVPGHLAAGLALEHAGAAARRVDVGYFLAPAEAGRVAAALPSGGTRASLIAMLGEPGFSWRDGGLRTERSARRVRAFDCGDRVRRGVSIGSSEAFALPRSHPHLDEVGVYLGWLDPLSRGMQVASVGAGALRARPLRRMLERASARAAAAGGPSAQERARWSSVVVAEAFDGHGERMARVVLDGPEPYTFTGEIMAWAALRAAAGDIEGAGALGPLEAFGLPTLSEGCAEAGLRPAGEDAVTVASLLRARA